MLISELLPMIKISCAGKTSLAPASVEPSSAPHPKSYMEVNQCLAVIFLLPSYEVISEC